MQDEVQQDELNDLRALHARMRELSALRRKVGLAFYTPHRKQDLFHRAGSFRYRYVRSGNRFGKSELGGAEDSAFAYGERLWYPKDDPARSVGIPKHPTKGLIVTTDWDKSRSVFTETDGGELGKLFRMLPADAVRVKRNHSGFIDRVYVKRPIHLGGGESAIHIDTVQAFKQNAMSQESDAWDYVHIDEPIPEQMYKAIARGLVDRGGKTWFTCTPLSEVWINDMFVVNRRHAVAEGEPYIPAKDKWMITGSINDNPHNKAEDIAAFEALLSKDEIACRLHGIPLSMSGMVYKEFDPEAHVFRDTPFEWDDVNRPPLDWTIRLAIDPHPRTPHAVLFAATSPLGYTYFYDNIFDACLISELCERIIAKTKGYFVQECIIDPIANTRNPVDGKTMKDEFDRCGVFTEDATKDLSGGILKVKELLKAKITSGSAVHKRLKFGAHLERTLWEFDHYVWDGDKGKPLDKDDHMMECLYRLCLTDLPYIAPPDVDEESIRRAKRRTAITDMDFDNALDADLGSVKLDDYGLDAPSYRTRQRRKYRDAY